MKNKLFKNNDEFRQLKLKMLFRIVVMVLVSITIIFMLYIFKVNFNVHFADWIVTFFQKIFGLEYDAACDLYQSMFRNHLELIFLIAISLIFFVIFRIYLNWFAKYFHEINRGIDTLVNENTEDISLVPELSATEKKINSIRHTLLQQKMNTQLAEQKKNDLVMYLAHDLKTPLASVIGYLNLLRDEKEISDELREKYISISLEKAERLEDLINEFFEIARLNLSDITLQCSKINLTRLIEQLAYEFKPMLSDKNLTCNIETENDIIINCDGDKIQRAFDNLLRNAVIYSFENSEINIAVKAVEDSVSIEFTNHGNTISKENLERIFEQFYRLDAARGTNGGAGLGLAIAKQIIELHGGAITAKSENDLIEFTVTLPLS